MCSYDVTVEQCRLPAVFEEQRRDNLGGRRFSRTAQSGKPQAHALSISRPTGLRQDARDLLSNEPRRHFPPFTKKLFAKPCAGQRLELTAAVPDPDLVVSPLAGQVSEFAKRNDLYPDFRTHLSGKFLRRGRFVVWFSIRVGSRACMVTADDQVAGTGVSTND